jgi:phosphoglycolate phosphatase-like HAD superfamily hydrolase
MVCDKGASAKEDLLMIKRVVVFDLDETLVNSKHRTPNRPDGTLDLDRYFALKTRENIMRDTLLPLAETFKQLDRSENYVVICTARAMNEDDFDFLKMHNLRFHAIMRRPLNGSENHIPDGALKLRKIKRLLNLRQFHNLPVIMFDDAKPVIAAIRRAGMVCLNAISVNRKLAA